MKSATGAKGQALWKPLRLALTGAAEGPELAPLLKAMPDASHSRPPEPLRRMIRIHNSLTGEKQELEARRARPRAHVQLRHHRLRLLPRGQCPHAGGVRHGEPLPAASRLRVTYVRNITDVDDKIINRAREAGVDWRAHAKKFTARHARGSRRARLPASGEGTQGVGIHRRDADDDRPAHRQRLRLPGDERRCDVRRAQVRAVRQALRQETRRPARRRARGSGRAPSAIRSISCCGSRRSPASPRGRHPGATAGPAGTSSARPCRTKELGEHFDIHGGGLDLKFPHHENEIAQTCGATGGKFAEIWMHNGFLNIDNEKMSKSLGNFFTTREVLAKIKHPEVLRFFLLSSHYRGPMNYSPDQLDQAEAALTACTRRCATCRRRPERTSPRRPPRRSTPPWTTTSTRRRRSPCCRGWRASSTRRSDGTRHQRRPAIWRSELRALGGVLGLLGSDPAVVPARRGAGQAGGLERLPSIERATSTRRARSRRARRGTGPSPTASATSWPRPGSSSRTSPAGMTAGGASKWPHLVN